MISEKIAGEIKPTGRLPVQYIGMARDYRMRVGISRVRVGLVIDALLDKLRPKPGRVPMPRQSTLRQMPDVWRALNPFGRLGLSAQYNRESGLRITELRLVPASIVSADWDTDEPGVAVSSFHLHISPPAYSEYEMPLAAVGLHGLARYFQRTGSSDDYPVTRDLIALARGALHIIKNGLYSEFKIETTYSPGFWVGAYKEGDSMLITRTFLSS